MRFSFFFVVAVLAAGQTTFTVPLENRLRPDPAWEVAELQPLPGTPEGLRAFSTELVLRKGLRVRVVLMEREGSRPTWLIDRNLDGKVSADEAAVIGPAPTVILFPLAGAAFSSFPLQLKAMELPARWREDMQRRNVRFLLHSQAVSVAGKTAVDGKEYEFFYRVDPETLDVALSKSAMAVDANGDGEIDTEPWSEEVILALGRPMVLQAGQRYLRADAVDLKSMTATMTAVKPDDYPLISLRAGRTVPDFSFTDFEGNRRQFTEVRGARYTLLYFWATWCSICQSEIGKYEEAARRFGDRGFRVIGINGDKDTGTARAFATARDVTFPQAQWDSVRELVQHRFRIMTWPTAVLLDSGLRVVSTNMDGEMHIRREGLMTTLETLMSSPQPSAGR